MGRAEGPGLQEPALPRVSAGARLHRLLPGDGVEEPWNVPPYPQARVCTHLSPRPSEVSEPQVIQAGRPSRSCTGLLAQSLLRCQLDRRCPRVRPSRAGGLCLPPSPPCARECRTLGPVPRVQTLPRSGGLALSRRTPAPRAALVQDTSPTSRWSTLSPRAWLCSGLGRILIHSLFLLLQFNTSCV